MCILLAPPVVFDARPGRCWAATVRMTRPCIGALCIAGLLQISASPAFSESAASSEPVGIHTLVIRGASDTVLSLPMEQLPVFFGLVRAVTATSVTVAAGVTPDGTRLSPGWSANQFVYDVAAGQRRTFLLEFASGALKGACYKITANDLSTVTLETEGDDLTAHPRLGAVAVNDAVRIYPFWRVRDVFSPAGAPLIEARPNPAEPKDDLLFPSQFPIGINKAPSMTIYYLAGQGWRAAGSGAEDFSDHPLRPNQGFIVRRRNAVDLEVVNCGAAALVRSVSFVPGGDGTSANDSYISLVHPVAVTLDESGLRSADQANTVIRDSISDFARQDELLAWSPNSTGFNVAPSITYYYRAGQGWKQVGSTTIIGGTVMLQPGAAYIVRKKAQNPGVDWIKEPNF